MFNARLSVGIDYSPIAGLKFATSASGDAYFSNNHVFRPSYLNSNNLSSVEASRSMVAMIQWENILSYRFNLRDRHNFDLMAGMTTTYDLMENIKGKAAGGPTNKIYEIGDGWPQARNVEGRDEYLQRVTTDRQEQIMLSYLGRVAYNFDKRYMLEASLRYDGSSVFGRDVRWAAFPSLGAAWAFSKEQFMKDFWFLSFGKIRASWGKSGQKFQEAYLAHGLMEESNSFLGQPGLQPSAMANSHLTWEKSDQYDLGLDLDLFNYRFKVKVDYYYKHSYDLLMQVPTPGNFFISKTTWTNASAISNEGLSWTSRLTSCAARTSLGTSASISLATGTASSPLTTARTSATRYSAAPSMASIPTRMKASYRTSQLSPTTTTRRVCVYPSPSVRSLTHCVSVVVRSRTRTATATSTAKTSTTLVAHCPRPTGVSRIPSPTSASL